MKIEKDELKKLKDELLTHQYNAEASEDELDQLHRDFLIAIETNNSLAADLREQEKSLKARISELISENDRLTSTYEPYHPRRSVNRTPLGWWRVVRNHHAKYAADICFDFYPLSDWVRLSYHSFKPGRYAQLVVGPIRAEFYQQ